ncbi:uncharacterized protein Triagg1_9035 [Trichoderma aggressivum f. europaeum]|uniref:Uncharacterized protein n=1 Tax=Trichoderma aggressivum f. europaeum TaxID=173218 RepID=A0AAE1I7H2_9HYPO|nr:hypothetical protein Triagg1_9035 [Trichoderma aggressivum f. europaeum]
MKRSAVTYDIADGRTRPAKRAATSTTKKAAASTKKTTASTKKASASKESSSNGTAAAPPSQPLDDSLGKRTKTPLGPKGELMIPQVLPRESVKAIEKLLLPRGWVRTIDATPERSLSLSNRRWWEANGLWLESNKKALGLTAKQWKMKEEALATGSPLGEDDANTPEEFICIYPLEDEEDSNDGDGEDDDDDDDDDDDEARGSGNKASAADKETKKKEAEAKEEALCDRVGKLASRHPEHLWVSSLGGYERFKWWTQEICKRNQDDYSLHVYNDFSWYGTIEVLENLFVQFERVVKSKTAQPLEVWREVEGLALLLASGNAVFEMCDDGERCERVLELFGSMTIAGIDVLQKKGLFTKDSTIPNISMMLSLLIRYAWSMGRGDFGLEDTVTWIFYVYQQTEAAGITLGGPSGFEKILKEIKNEAPEHEGASLSKVAKGTFTSKGYSYGGGGGGLMF